MLHKFKLLDYFLLLLSLLKGRLGKRNYRSQYDTNTDYFKIFTNIKDMRSKIPDFYNTDVTFEPERAYLLLRDPSKSKRASIISPLNDMESTTLKKGTSNDNDYYVKMSFQKREDDPLHQEHGVGEGLAAFPESLKEMKQSSTAIAASIVKLKDLENNGNINEEGKTKIYSTNSLGMIPESISNKSIHQMEATRKEEIINKDGFIETKKDLDAKSSDPLNLSPILIQALEKLERRKGENDSSEVNDKDTAGNIPHKNSSDITELLESIQKNVLKNISETIPTSTNSSIDKENSSKINIVTRNMIVDSGIKGFLAKVDQFTFGDVGVRKTNPFNGSYPQKVASNLATNISSRSNISDVEGNEIILDGVMTGQQNKTNATDLSNLKNKVNSSSNDVHEDSILLSKKTDLNNSTNLVAKKSDEPKPAVEPIASKLERMLGNAPNDNITSAKNNEVNLSRERISEKALTDTHPDQHTFSALHLASITDEMKDHSAAPHPAVTGIGAKKDKIDAIFEPECSATKKCPKGKYCRHFDCFDCHNKHHECIADEQCCNDMPCIYGRCDTKAKKSPGAICRKDSDCDNGCCVLEPTINIETGICKIKLGEFHQCSPVLYRKVWIGNKKPSCGPCEDGLECKNKGVIATHLVCMKKKG